jgi:hypothetical protein
MQGADLLNFIYFVSGMVTMYLILVLAAIARSSK